MKNPDNYSDKHSDNYSAYCKPSLAAALHSVGLDQTFHRAQGQYLYYRDAQGQERQVLDLLGGYGAVILGHNPPRLVQALQRQLAEQVPFHNQFSLRKAAGDLAADLNPILQQQTGWQEPFLCALASTGAESVELALKHAEFARGRHLDQLQEKLQRTLAPFEGQSDWQIEANLLQGHPGLQTDKPGARWQFIQQWNQQKLNQAPLFIALKQAFHGKLNSSIQLTHGEIYRKPLRRLGLNTRFFHPGELTEAALKKLHAAEQPYVFTLKKRGGRLHLQIQAVPLVAAIIVEPVQGEGGVHCLTQRDAQQLHYARDSLGCPLIADEIQSGCGRCGHFLAGSAIGLQPDYVVLSKGLGGGVSKIGLVAIRERRYAQGFDLIQSSTFGEDEWSATIARTFIQYLMQDKQAVLKQVQARGKALGQALNRLHQAYPDSIADIRGRGLLYGVELQRFDHRAALFIKTADYQEALGYVLTGCLFQRWGIRVAPPASSGRVLRIEPSVQLSDSNIHTLVTALEDVCLALRYQDTGYLFAHLLDDPALLARPPKDYRPWYGHLQTLAPSGAADSKVAFINHLISSEWIKEVDPSLAHLSDQQTAQLLTRLSFDRRVAPFPPVRMVSKQGQSVDFILYPLAITSQEIAEMMANNQLEGLREMIDERLRAARKDGCEVAGLGMFTSIVTNNAKAVNTAGIYLTTGNALTVAMAAEAIDQAIARRGYPIAQAAIMGAAGNIGSVYSILVAEYCPSLILVGSDRMGSLQRLSNTAGEVYATVLGDMVQLSSQQSNQGPDQGLAQSLRPYAEKNRWLDPAFYQQKNCGRIVYQWFEQHLPEQQRPIRLSQSLEAIAQVDLLVCATNAAEDCLTSAQLKNNLLICDIAVPHNISQSLLEQRPDIECIRGGVVKTPHGESLDTRARAYLKAGQLYACMAEAVVLGLENYQGHYSYGNIGRQQVKEIRAYAREHGLSLAEYKMAESM